MLIRFAAFGVLLLAVLLAGCGSSLGEPAAQTPQATGVVEMTPTSGNAGAADTPGAAQSYPKTGHAPDYSWVAGQVVVTRIQGGCIFVKTDTEQFSPNGDGWDSSKFSNNDYVVVFGHIAQAGDPVEVCPGGKPYIVDKVQANP